MTDPTDDLPDGTPDIRAAEYALGLLADAERAAFEARLRDDPALAAAVAGWQARFARMAEDEVAPVAPPPRVQAALERRLFAPGRPAQATSLWQRLGLWQGLAALGLATSVALAVFLVARPVPPPEPPPEAPFAAQLSPTEGADAFLAVYEPGTATLRIRRAAGDPRPGRAQELWLIAEDAAPVSLGLLGDDGQATLTLPASLRDVLPDGVLAVSDEPPGGSPTGAPTGDVLALGAVTRL